MSVVIGVVRIVGVVIVVNGLAAGVIRMVRIVPRIVGAVAPSVAPAPVVPVGVVPVGTVVVAWPPPIVTQVDTDAPAGWIIIIPVQIGEVGVVVSPTGVHVGVEPTEAGTVTVVVIVVGIVAVAASGD